MRSQIERAEADNAASWRSTAAICVCFLCTVIFAPFIPLVLIATGIGNARRTRAAEAGTYDAPPTLNDHAVAMWCIATAVAAAGVFFVVIGLSGGALGGATVGAVLVLIGVALRPWRHPLRRSNPAD